MSKVEELRERLIQAIGTYGVAEDKGMPSELCETLDSLIAAANEEGCDDGWAASKMLWTRMQKWNDEWRAENPKERSLTLLDAMDLIEWKIAKAREEGAEEARPKIAESTEKLIDWIIAMIPPEGANPEWGRKVLLDLVATATEQMVQKIQKAAYRCKPGETLHINNSIPMLVLASSVVNPEDTDFEPKHYRCIWNEEPFTSCEDYRKAGGQAEHCPWFEDKDDHLHLSPAPKELT